MFMRVLYVCVPRVCLVPSEAEKGHQSPWNWSYRWCEPLRVLGSEPESSECASEWQWPLSVSHAARAGLILPVDISRGSMSA